MNLGTTNRLMPFTPSGAPCHAGQHQVDDVLGHVVLTPGDEDLGAENLVGAIGLRLGTRTHQGQVRTRLRLGQVHGAGPFAGDQVFQVDGLELVAEPAVSSASMAPSVRAMGTGETHVGAVDHFAAGGTNGFGQALATRKSVGCCRPCQPPSANCL